MRLEKQFDVDRPRAEVVRAVARDETLLDLFPEAETEIVASRGETRTVRSRYRALGQEGTATFHFTFRADGDVGFEKVCDGRVWRELSGSVRFEPCGKATRVRIQMEGRTKSLVPEFAIRGPMREQIEQMATALRQRIEAG